MVKPTVKGGKTAKAVKFTKESRAQEQEKMFKAFTKAGKFQDKVLLATANKWAEKYSFDGDIEFSRVSDTGKSVHIKVNGKEATSKYCLVGTMEKPSLISGKAIAMASRR